MAFTFRFTELRSDASERTDPEGVTIFGELISGEGRPRVNSRRMRDRWKAMYASPTELSFGRTTSEFSSPNETNRSCGAGAKAVNDRRLEAVVVASHHPNWREGQVIDVDVPPPTAE